MKDKIRKLEYRIKNLENECNTLERENNEIESEYEDTINELETKILDMEDSVKRTSQFVDELILTWSKDRIRDFLCELTQQTHRATDEEIMEGLKKLL